MIFGNAKWIWSQKDATLNEYVEFHESFSYNGERAILRLCAESDYVVHLNGKRILFCQFANYRNEKYYDEDDISSLCKIGENRLCITVRHEGMHTAIRVSCGAGAIYSLLLDGKETVYSSKDSLCRHSPCYLGSENKLVTSQLGLTSTAIACNEGPEDIVLHNATEVDLSYNIVKRPVERFEELPRIHAKKMDIAGKRIYDLGREETGYLFVKARCASPTTLRVGYAEYLTDNTVRYLIGHRSFCLDFVCNEGENCFEQLFIRIAGRYLQVENDDVEILELGIIPVLYPVTEKSHSFTGLEKRIYDTCVRTLRLCMHTHYEDCPWREQALYVMDSRNQMLCGYYAFEETAFQRANLVLMSKGKRSDGMLELTYPAEETPAIPFFSAMYPIAVYEYMKYTGDYSIARETVPTIISILDALVSFKQDGLIVNPPAPYWNFYEWSEGNAGALFADDGGRRELILNCAFVYAVKHLEMICELADIECPDYNVDEMKNTINEVFFDEESGIFRACHDGGIPSALGNSFALLIGLGDDRTLEALKRDDLLTPATLSMLSFVYDALLSDPKNADFVLEDIRKNYSYMLECGATSFWETIKGASDFDNSGSLCHGWSAIPIYYFNKLLNI